MKKTSLAQLATGLGELQLPRNHIYIVHSSMLRFGVIEGGLTGALACLRDLLGPDATILMPAFTFAYGRTRVWDYHASKAETGALTEYFRRQPGVLRSVHPFHSICASGPYAAAFADCADLSSFGPASPFARLLEAEAINLALGTDFVGGATFLHHTEEAARVPYRHDKPFPGEVIDADGLRRPGPYSMYVREIAERHEYANRWDHVWADFVADGLAKQSDAGGVGLFALPIRPTHDRFWERLRDDPYYCAVKIIQT